MGKLFGTDGIRGKANQYPITPDFALNMGRVIGMIFAGESASGQGNPRVIVGKDTRLSGYMLETALTSGLLSMGMDVFEVGPLPTPAIAHLTKSMCADCGIMISASHNPASDNGIKLFHRDGFRFPDELEELIEKRILDLERNPIRDGAAKIGKAFRIDDARGRYIEFAKTSIRNRSLCGIKAVLDCANGAGYYTAPLILKEMGVDVIRTATSPDGSNINDRCGALCPQTIIRLVKEHKADIGIALDGDADRVTFCDAEGNVVNGDHIVGFCALDLKNQNRLAHDTVAVTTMTNLGMIEAMHAAGIQTEITDVGARYVIERMQEKGLTLGGEQSGHIIFSDDSTTGDGIISALHVLDLMKTQGKSIAELAAFMVDYPQMLLSEPIRERIPIAELPKLSSTIELAEKALGESGRVIVRYSGTEDQIRVLVEARQAEDVKFWTGKLLEAVKHELS